MAEESCDLLIRVFGNAAVTNRLQPDAQGVVGLDSLGNGSFNKSDKPFDGAQVRGKFTCKQGHTYNLNGQTNNEGIITIVLPEGTVDSFTAEKDKIGVSKQGNIAIPPPAPTPVTVPRPPKYIIIDLNSSSFSSSINPTEKDARVVILGDISGSMGAETQMDILRRSFQEIFDKCQKNKWSVSLAAWNDKIDWCTETWIQSSQAQAVKSWIGCQRARGGNDMRRAIEDCMKRYSSATDVYVMCDGDITPFANPEVDWRNFRNQFLKTKFHFIALGAHAAYAPMETMATIGGGTFTHTT
ncbi:hypothetical protein I4U23_015956 [Adineta vaga]|nr:hypothetical protein I4U23_015956 [Adineta vaga]